MRVLLIIAGAFALGGISAAQETPRPPAEPTVQKAVKPTPPKGAAPKIVLQDPGAVFAGLTGSCFQAPLTEGNTDTHCFTAAFNGKLVMDVHRVRNAAQAVVYEGVTVYRPDKATRSLKYDYSNSFGDLLPGQAWRTGQDLLFSSQSGHSAKAETTWRLAGDGYDVLPADPKAAKLHFKKTGPVTDGGL